MLRHLISIVLALLTVLAVQPAFLGSLGLVGRLSDTDHRPNLLAGAQLLGIAIIIWSTSLAWFIWLRHESIRWQISLRGLLIFMTLAALLLGFAAFTFRALD
jgi:hypothetical protein